MGENFKNGGNNKDPLRTMLDRVNYCTKVGTVYLNTVITNQFISLSVRTFLLDNAHLINLIIWCCILVLNCCYLLQYNTRKVR